MINVKCDFATNVLLNYINQYYKKLISIFSDKKKCRMLIYNSFRSTQLWKLWV